jgi:hypothetical protein
MATIRVNKVEAARRQIDAAIKLLFDGGDPVAVHTLAAAGGRILRDLCAAKGTPFIKSALAAIRPGMEGEFWAAFNGPANFLKHADEDPDGILEGIDEEANDIFLFLAALHYADLGYSLTPEMTVIQTMVTVMHPDFLRPEGANMLAPYLNDLDWFRRMSRPERLKLGKELLAVKRALPR